MPCSGFTTETANTGNFAASVTGSGIFFWSLSVAALVPRLRSRRFAPFVLRPRPLIRPRSCASLSGAIAMGACRPLYPLYQRKPPFGTASVSSGYGVAASLEPPQKPRAFRVVAAAAARLEPPKALVVFRPLAATFRPLIFVRRIAHIKYFLYLCIRSSETVANFTFNNLNFNRL